MSLTPSPNGDSTYSPGSTVNHPGYSPGTTVNPAGYSPASSTVNPAGYSPASTVNHPGYSPGTTVNHPGYSPSTTVNHPGYSQGTTVNSAYSPAPSTGIPGYSPISTVNPGSNEYSNPGTPDTTTSENPPIQQTSFDENSKAQDLLLRSILMRKEEYEESQPLKSEVTDAGLPSGENTNQNHFENPYQAQLAAYQQYYQQNPHLMGHHHGTQHLNPGQPGYQNPYQPHAAHQLSNVNLNHYYQQQQIYAHYQQQQIYAQHQQQQIQAQQHQHQQLSPGDQVQNHQQAHQHPSAQHGQQPDHHQFFNNSVEQKHVDTGNISNSNTSDTQAAMTTLMQHTAQTIVQQKIMGNPHLNHHEAVGPGFESRLMGQNPNYPPPPPAHHHGPR